MNWISLLLLLPAALIVLGVLLFSADLKTSGGNPKPLRNDIKKRFYRELEGLGYARKSTSLCTTFRKVAGDRVRIVQLSWDKYHRPSFSLGFGETPNAVISSPLGDVSPDAVEPCHSEALGELQRRARRHSASDAWFKLRRPWFEVLTTGRLRYEPEQVVDQLIRTYPQVERWFETREVGPNVRMLRTEAQKSVGPGGRPADSAKFNASQPGSTGG